MYEETKLNTDFNIGSVSGIEKPQSQIGNELGTLERKITDLSDLVGSLEDKLSIVLSPGEPMGESKDDQGTLIPLASSIRIQSNRINIINNKINNITQRIEL